MEIDPAIAAELDDCERRAGLQVAVVEEYRDGFYQQRVELTLPMLGEFTGENPPLVIPEAQYVPCHIPRVRSRVVWRRFDEVT